MSNEEFQKVVLAEFSTLRQDVQRLGQEVQTTRQELHGQIDATRLELHEEIETTRLELHQEIETTRLEMRERFDRVERHAEENAVSMVNLIRDKVSGIQEALRSVTEVLGDHEVRIRNLTRRPV